MTVSMTLFLPFPISLLPRPNIPPLSYICLGAYNMPIQLLYRPLLHFVLSVIRSQAVWEHNSLSNTHFQRQILERMCRRVNQGGNYRREIARPKRSRLPKHGMTELL